MQCIACKRSSSSKQRSENAGAGFESVQRASMRNDKMRLSLARSSLSTLRREAHALALFLSLSPSRVILSLCLRARGEASRTAFVCHAKYFYPTLHGFVFVFPTVADVPGVRQATDLQQVRPAADTSGHALSAAVSLAICQ